MDSEQPVELSERDLELVAKLQAQPELDLNSHKWIQKGYEIIDDCGSCIRQGIKIPNGKMLVGERGSYKLVDEIPARV